MRASIIFVLLNSVCTETWAANEDKDFRWAQNLYQLQEYTQATEAFSKYLVDFPKSERADQALLLLTESFYQLKDFPQAAKNFERFLNDHPSSSRRAEAMQRAVKAHWYTRNFTQCAARADMFLKENQDRLDKPGAPPALRAWFETVLYYGGDASYGLKNFERAQTFWERLLKDFSQPPSALIPDAAEGLGWIAFEAGRFDAALKYFSLTAGTPLHPKAASCNLMCARALDQLNRMDDALSALEKSAGLTGGKDLTREIELWRAAIYLHAKRYPETISALRTLIQDFPAHSETPTAVLQAALQTEERGKNAEALELAGLYLASFPKGRDRAPVSRINTRALVALKRLEEALTAAQAAVKESDVFPLTSPEAQENRPAALMLLADLSGSAGKAHYESILKDFGSTRYAPPARYQLACLASQNGNLEEALSHAETLLKNLPIGKDDSVGLRRKTLFAASDFSFRLKRYAKAEEFLTIFIAQPVEKSSGVEVQSGLVQLRLAWCRYESKDAANAVTLLDQALASHPQGEILQEIHYLRGRARIDLLPTTSGAQGSVISGGSPSSSAGTVFEDYATLLKDAPTSNFTAHACFDAAQLLAAIQPAEALKWIDPLIENQSFARSPLRPDALLLRSRINYLLHRYNPSLSDADSALASGLLSQKTPAARLLRALSLVSLDGKQAEAEEACSALIKAGPAEAIEVKQGLLQRGKLRFNARRFEEALSDLSTFLGRTEATENDVEAIEATLLAALCQKELKNLTAAQAQLDALSRLKLRGPAAFEVPFQRGNLAYESGANSAAAAHYRQALDAAELVKELPPALLSAAWLNLAWSHKRTGSLADSEKAFGNLLKLDPSGPYASEARYQRGKLLAETGNLEMALALWQELLDKQGSDPLAEKALASMAEAQAKAGHFSEAALAYEQYLGKFPSGSSSREAWRGLGECRTLTKNPTGAREAFMKALGEKGLDAELDETGERAVLGLAELLLNQGEAGEAKKLAWRVVKDRPDSNWLDSVLYLCARCSETMAEPNQAIGYYRKLLTDRPQSALAEKAKEKLKELGAR